MDHNSANERTFVRTSRKTKKGVACFFRSVCHELGCWKNKGQSKEDANLDLVQLEQGKSELAVRLLLLELNPTDFFEIRSSGWIRVHFPPRNKKGTKKHRTRFFAFVSAVQS